MRRVVNYWRLRTAFQSRLMRAVPFWSRALKRHTWCSPGKRADGTANSLKARDAQCSAMSYRETGCVQNTSSYPIPIGANLLQLRFAQLDERAVRPTREEVELVELRLPEDTLHLQTRSAQLTHLTASRQRHHMRIKWSCISNQLKHRAQ